MNMLLVVIAFLWTLLGMMLSVRFRQEHDVSRFELIRLRDQGDPVARDMVAHAAEQPAAESLRQIIITIVSTLLVTTSVFAFGLVGGIIIGAGLLIVAPLLIRLAIVRQLADQLRDRVWPYVSRTVRPLGPVLRLLRERDPSAAADPRVFSEAELLDMIARSPGVLTSEQVRRLKANLRFDDRTVGDVMTPKGMMVTADAHDTLGPLVMSELHRSGHSRFPVVDDDIDHIVGILYLKELIDLKTEHQTVRSAMNRRVFFIREDQNLEHVLHGFLRSHHHLFVVVNEYRETVGLITLEDVIEALIGRRIVDEFDAFDDIRAVAASNPRRNNHVASGRNI